MAQGKPIDARRLRTDLRRAPLEYLVVPIGFSTSKPRALYRDLWGILCAPVGHSNHIRENHRQNRHSRTLTDTYVHGMTWHDAVVHGGTR